MALARLLYEFAPLLAGLVPDLLPAVLLLLRSRAREVVKSVLGVIKVGRLWMLALAWGSLVCGQLAGLCGYWWEVW